MLWRPRAEQFAIPADHPHAVFLRGRLRDSLNRLILPSLEREVRRELTDHAELHAVQVFARNLRKLLLQPPVHNRRVLAIDPGFRSGCKLAALDEFGTVLGHTVIHVIGKDEVVRRGRQQMVEMILMYHIPIIAIGNGTACRETEKLVADVIANELKHRDTSYIVVNEAGASVYSTSSVGREELPRFDPVLRSAVSIGRRLQDPLSELVKINPANIGVGLYQHDVRAKHLQDSLDAVVESCVNFVGVDVNTASPALLRYVSGLNQLTARRLYEYRQKHGPFRSRDQFKQVPGFGEATFVQSAGFLKIVGGDNPLDATWIHPESYETAERVIDKLGGTIAELATKIPGKKTAVPIARGAMAQFARGVLSDSHHHERHTKSEEAAPEPLSPAEPQPAAEARRPAKINRPSCRCRAWRRCADRIAARRRRRRRIADAGEPTAERLSTPERQRPIRQRHLQRNLFRLTRRRSRRRQPSQTPRPMERRSRP
jgi:protein Tex